MMSSRNGFATILGHAALISTAVAGGVAVVLAFVFWIGSEIVPKVPVSMPQIGWYCIFLAALLAGHWLMSFRRPQVDSQLERIAPTRQAVQAKYNELVLARRRWSMTLEYGNDEAVLPKWRFWLLLAFGLGGAAATVGYGVGLHLPILTTFLAAFFASTLFIRYREKGGGAHIVWWGIGIVTYGVSSFAEAFTTLFGWDPLIFRCWYVAGALLGGYPLAQGSIYLLMNRRFADWSARIVSGLIVLGSIFVILTPLNVPVGETHRLSGQVIDWSWIRLIAPFINLYAVTFLASGAALSAWRFSHVPAARNRYLGNILIAVGAFLPAIGGTVTRFGNAEAYYITEFVGVLLIFAGYRKCVAPPRGKLAARTVVEIT